MLRRQLAAAVIFRWNPQEGHAVHEGVFAALVANRKILSVGQTFRQCSGVAVEVSPWLRRLCTASSHAPTAHPVPGGEGGPGPGAGQAEEAEEAGGWAEAQPGAAAQRPGHAAPTLGEAGGQEAHVPGG